MNNYFINESDDSKNTDAKNILGNLLQTSENYLYLIGAGCSVKSGGKIMSTLWTEFSSDIDNFDELKEKVGYKEGNNLEELLTRIKITEKYLEGIKENNIDTEADTEVELTKRDIIIKFRKDIEMKLQLHCKDGIKIGINSVHLNLISKITNGRKLSLPRTKIFSLNYDTLFEQAGNEGNYTIIDGFGFSIPRTFNGTNFDLDIVKRNKNYLENEDNFEKKVFHLYKLHGSVNWEEDEKGKITQFEGADGKLIYPGSSKYEESYEMPYFEMISRFQQELRKENVTLTIIGYSFSDSHINSMILEAFKTNPSLRLVIVGTSLFQKKYEIGDDEKLGFIKKEGTSPNEKSYFDRIVVESIKIFNEGLKMDRVFLFNMYFEPFVELLPLKNIKTKEEIMIEILSKFNTPTPTPIS